MAVIYHTQFTAHLTDTVHVIQYTGAVLNYYMMICLRLASGILIASVYIVIMSGFRKSGHIVHREY